MRFLAIIMVIMSASYYLAAQSAERGDLVAGEYFWDTDPGQGNGTPLTTTTGSYYMQFASLLQTGIALPSGIGAHTFNMRTQDSIGNWGPVFKVVVNEEESTDSLRGDAITAGEYFWDTDPGQGNGDPMLAVGGSFTTAFQNVYQSGIALPAVGTHTLNMRSRDYAGNWGSVFSVVVNVEGSVTALRGDAVTAGEYFWDTDPGFGNGNPMLAVGGSFTTAFQNIYQSGIALPSVGTHTLNVRSKDTAGNWGPAFSVVVDVEGAVTTLRADDVIAGEYFWDTDPGQGSGNPMLAAGGSFTTAVQNIYQSGIALPGVGNHTLNVRSRDTAGNWGPVFSVVVEVEGAVATLRADAVIAGEYFWDTDPGQGHGNPMLAAGGSFNTAFQNIYQSGIALPGVGNHTLNVRSQDTAGNWGPVFSVVVEVEGAVATLRADAVIAGEYFWDTDPGQGHGNPMLAVGGSFTTAFKNIYQSGIALPSVGTHILNVRSQDTAGNWGPVFSVVVDVEGAVATLRADAVKAGEYFWDADPGQGNGNPMLAVGGSFTNAFQYIYQSGIALPSVGTHLFSARSKDTAGNWGPVFSVVVDVEGSTATLRSDGIVAAECFFDVDPGQGNGTPMVASGGSFGNAFQKIQGGNLPTPITPGIHVFYMRTKDIAGKWGPVFGVVDSIDTLINLSAQIVGPQTLCANNLAGVIYHNPTTSNATYAWTIEGGNIVSSTDSDSIIVNWNSSGPYQLKLVVCNLSAQCDSDSISITMKPVATDTINTSICHGQSYDSHSTGGTYLDTFAAANSCDSIRTLILIVLPLSNTSISQTICAGQTFDGHSKSGTYVDTLTSSNGCDSIVTLTLTVSQPVNDTIRQTICDGQLYSGHSASGTYVDTLITGAGCDSIVTLILIVSPPLRDTVRQTICDGQSYSGHGSGGTYVDTLLTGAGCDSIVTLILTVSPAVRDTVSQSVCQGQSVDGHSTGGTYVDTLTTYSGCDSIRTLVLSILPVHTTTVDQSICQGQSYEGHTTAGSYPDTFTGSNGCDSIVTLVLTVLPNSSSSINQSICQGQSYDGHTSGGSYVDTFIAANGCDSVRTLTLTVLSTLRDTFNQTICAGQSYKGHNTSGTYIDTLTSSGGCDSIYTLNLTVSPGIRDTISQSICLGQNYDGHSANGTYTDSFTTLAGCDSVRVLNLTVTSVITDTMTTSICPGQSYGGHSISGTYVDTFVAQGGCDSIRTLNLTVLPLNSDTLTRSICAGTSYGGHTQNGTYIDTFTSSAGCDSIRTLYLTVLPNSSDTISQTICQGATFDGYTSSGIFVDTFISANGCDSLRTLNLTVLPVSNETISESICQGTIYDGYTASGTYVDTFTASNGCDSIRTLDLTVLPTYADTIKENICQGDSFNGHKVTGYYVDTFMTTSGCDSIITLGLFVNPNPDTPTITQHGDTLMSSTAVVYQWYNGATLLTGDTSQMLIVTSDGDYSVQITDNNGCSNQSAELIWTGINNLFGNTPGLAIFPNPTTGLVNIQLSGLAQTDSITIKLFDDLGRLISARMQYISAGRYDGQLDLHDLAQGMYMVQVKYGEAVISRRIILTGNR